MSSGFVPSSRKMSQSRSISGFLPRRMGRLLTKSIASQMESHWSTARARLCSRREPARLDLPTLQAACHRTLITGEECYEAFERVGLDYGPAFRGVEHVSVGEDQLLAKISLPASLRKTQGQFVLHPSLMD